jgi:hypothetical protein
LPTTSTLDVTHRQLAELQRTMATRATQLEQLALDISRLVGDAEPNRPPSPWSTLLDGDFRRAWRSRHRDGIRQLVAELEDQATHLGELRRHLLPAADDPATGADA